MEKIREEAATAADTLNPSRNGVTNASDLDAVENEHIPENFGNQKNISFWTFEENYLSKNETLYPRRLQTVDDKLMVAFHPHLHDEVFLKSETYTINLHHPGEISPITHAIEIESTGKIYDIFIKPEIITASEGLRPYAPYRKKCSFSDERYLQYYKIYTQRNCRLECWANYTLRNCGCIPAYLPHYETSTLCGGSDNMSICVINSDEMMTKLESGVIDNHLNLPLCNCLPSCNLIIYNSEVQAKPLISSGDYASIVTFQFKEAEFDILERHELFGDVNFLASCGGILGLFTGFSVLSLAEMIYYLVFRWLYRLCRRLWNGMCLYRFRTPLSN